MSTREAWLELATEKLRMSVFLGIAEFPRVRVSVGWPYGAKSGKLKAIGQYWPAALATDKLPQIFISPKLGSSLEHLETLVHELVHACVPDAGHGKAFKRIALAVGLTGKMRATVAGDALKARLNDLISEIGDIPHGAISLQGKAAGAPKKQSTRLIPVECASCGYKARTTRKWLDEIGAPLCACNAKPMFIGGE